MLNFINQSLISSINWHKWSQFCTSEERWGDWWISPVKNSAWGAAARTTKSTTASKVEPLLLSSTCSAFYLRSEVGPWGGAPAPQQDGGGGGRPTGAGKMSLFLYRKSSFRQSIIAPVVLAQGFTWSYLHEKVLGLLSQNCLSSTIFAFQVNLRAIRTFRCLSARK